LVFVIVDDGFDICGDIVVVDDDDVLLLADT